MVAVVVTLYGKPGCHLCDDARAAILEALAGRDAELEEVDVTLDPMLERRYGERIPVLALDGEELFQYFVDGDALRERLDKVGA
jgi:glutaredoxin